MGKRALAMLLALMMLVSLVPVQVFAEEPEVPSQEIVEEIIPEESDEDLIAEPEEGDGQDEQITSEDDVLVPEDGIDAFIPGGGDEVQGRNDVARVSYVDEGEQAFATLEEAIAAAGAVDGDGYQFGTTVTLIKNVSIVSLSIDKTVTLDLNGLKLTVGSDEGLKAVSGGNVTLTGGTLAGNVTAGSGAVVSIIGGTVTGTVAAEDGGTLQISGGSFSVKPDDAYLAEGYEFIGEGPFTPQLKTFTVIWCDEDGVTPLETDENVPYGSTPSFNGAAPSKEATDDTVYTFAGWNPAPVAVTADASYTATFTSSERLYVVSFNSNGGSAVETQNLRFRETVTKPADPTYEGFAFCGWKLGDNYYDFDAPVTADIELVAAWEKAVAEINGKPYSSVQAAIDAAEAGGTVKLVDNVALEAQLVIGGKVILDLNGHKITGSIDDAILVNATGDLTLTGAGSIEIENWTAINNAGSLTIENVTVKAGVSGGANTIYNEGTLAVTGGVIEANGENSICAIWNEGAANISGGTVSAVSTKT